MSWFLLFWGYFAIVTIGIAAYLDERDGNQVPFAYSVPEAFIMGIIIYLFWPLLAGFIIIVELDRYKWTSTNE
jgi:hypothetical protein